MHLYSSPDEVTRSTGNSRTIRVIDTRTNRRFFADPQQVEMAESPGLILHRNRKGVVIGAMLVWVEEPATASHIGAHSKGAAYRETAIGGNLWALTGTPGARQ